jgi:ABC-2 type transport system permease protein
MQPAPEALRPEPAPAEQTARYGEVFDRGYRHYDGPRLGRNHARRALIGYSVKRAMGIKKSWTAKVIPMFLYIAISIPVIVTIGIAGFLPNAEVLDYADFFGFVFLLQGVFAATIAPEMLSTDRHEKVLSLYFSRAITRLDYILSKLGATALLMMTMSLVPAAILWLGRQLLDDSPLSAMKNNIDDLGRVIVAGVLISLYIGSVALMVSSFTGRKSIAVAVIIILFLVSTSLAFALAVAVDAEWDKYLVFLSPTNTVDGMADTLFRQTLPVSDFEDNPYLPFWQYAGGMLAVTAVSVGVMLWRYLPDE